MPRGAGYSQVGNWSLVSDANNYQGDYLYSAKGTGADTVTWTVGSLAAGTGGHRAKNVENDVVGPKGGPREVDRRSKNGPGETSPGAVGFLEYQNDAGLFADFHSNRHTFISNLSKAGVSPKMAQELARHSDIRLTMQVYTHLELHDQAAAIESLPAPPEMRREYPEPVKLQATGTDGNQVESGQKLVPKLVPSGA